MPRPSISLLINVGILYAEPSAFCRVVSHDFCPRSRSDYRELASYEVAGKTPAIFIRPERTMDSAVPLGRNIFGTDNPARCAGLISGVAPRQKIRVHPCPSVVKIPA
jgi:hypothetical protein